MFEKRIVSVLSISLIVKILLSGLLPLSPDEAYYWVWSHNLQLSYFDHPPFVSWLYLFGQPLENFFSFVRLPGVALGHATIVIWILLLKDYLNRDQLFSFTLLSCFMPFLGPAGLIITPDTPMMFFWSLCLFFMSRLIQSHKTYFSFLLGMSFGLGFCSKYPIVLVLPVLLLWLFLKKDSLSKTQIIKWILIGTLSSILFSFPVWFWNLTNSMQSFGFQLKHGFGGSGIKPKYFIDYSLAQIGLLFPTIVLFAWRARKQTPTWLLTAAVFPLAFFGISSFFAYAEVNWPIAAHPAVLAMASITITRTRWEKFTATIWLVVILLVVSEGFFHWLPNTGIRLKTDILSKYEKVAEHVATYENVYARTYQMASAVSFTNQKFIYKLRGFNRFDFFDTLKESLPKSKEFYLILKINEPLPQNLQSTFMILKREPIDESFDFALMKKVAP